MRTSPCVALPFGSGRKRTELVGLLLHPVSRSETWRRLVTPGSAFRSPTPSVSFKAPGAGLAAEPLCLADVPRSLRAGRLEEINCETTTTTLYSINAKFPRKKQWPERHNGRIYKELQSLRLRSVDAYNLSIWTRQKRARRKERSEFDGGSLQNHNNGSQLSIRCAWA